MQRHQKQRDRYCLLSTGWLPCLPASRAASLVTGWSSQCSGKSLYYWAVWSLLSNPLDKGLLWVARMQANLEPKLPPITPQVQKHFIQNPIMCVPTSSNLNTFLERSYCLGQGLLYSQWPMRRHLLWQWQWLGSFSKKKWPHDWLSWGSSTPKDPGDLWAVSEAPQSSQLWNCGFIHLLSCGTPLRHGLWVKYTMREGSVYPSVLFIFV